MADNEMIRSGSRLADLLEDAIRHVDFRPCSPEETEEEDAFVATCKQAVKDWRVLMIDGSPDA